MSVLPPRIRFQKRENGGKQPPRDTQRAPGLARHHRRVKDIAQCESDKHRAKHDFGSLPDDQGSVVAGSARKSRLDGSGTAMPSSSFRSFHHLFQRLQVRQPRDDQLLFVGLARSHLAENVIGESFARPNEFRAITVLELLEDVHGPLDGGRRDAAFDIIVHDVPFAARKAEKIIRGERDEFLW